MKITLKKIVVILLLTSFSLYFFEAYLIVKNRQKVKSIKLNKYKTYKKNKGTDFDKRSRIQVYKDLKKDDPKIVFTF